MSARRPARRAAKPARRPRLTVGIDDASHAAGVPGAAALRRAAAAAVAAGRRGSRDAELAIRIVGRREARAINRRWRAKDYAPNVLSFPAVLPRDLPRSVRSALLGDLVICAPVVAAEARAQGKSAAAHWAHMVVHGVLHLLGHDHLKRADAARMERLERRVLAGLGHPDPYLVDDR
jgi:probable rRNA maturation factor